MLCESLAYSVAQFSLKKLNESATLVPSDSLNARSDTDATSSALSGTLARAARQTTRLVPGLIVRLASVTCTDGTISRDAIAKRLAKTLSSSSDPGKISSALLIHLKASPAEVRSPHTHRSSTFNHLFDNSNSRLKRGFKQAVRTAP